MLDVHLTGENTFGVADVLIARGIPFAFATGFSSHEIPRRANEAR